MPVCHSSQTACGDMYEAFLIDTHQCTRMYFCGCVCWEGVLEATGELCVCIHITCAIDSQLVHARSHISLACTPDLAQRQAAGQHGMCATQKPVCCRLKGALRFSPGAGSLEARARAWAAKQRASTHAHWQPAGQTMGAVPCSESWPSSTFRPSTQRAPADPLRWDKPVVTPA